MLHEAAHFREETDLLGTRQVPKSAYWGVQTLRASENFSVSRVSLYNYSTLIRCLAMVKKACCMANKELEHMSDEYADAIIQACDEIIEGKFENQFIVDMMQGGAGNFN